jgi:hypothetical protein
MKAVLAAAIALAVLWIVDSNFNDGHYRIAGLRMARPILAHIGINV